MLSEDEVKAFYAWLDAHRSGPGRLGVDTIQRAISEIEHLRIVVAKLGRDPVFEVGGSVPENLAAIELHHWRRRVAEAAETPLPPDEVDEFNSRLEIERVRMAAEVAAAVAKQAAKDAERDAKARARREARKATAKPRARKVAAPNKPPPPKAPAAVPGQLDLF